MTLSAYIYVCLSFIYVVALLCSCCMCENAIDETVKYLWTHLYIYLCLLLRCCAAVVFVKTQLLSKWIRCELIFRCVFLLYTLLGCYAAYAVYGTAVQLIIDSVGHMLTHLYTCLSFKYVFALQCSCWSCDPAAVESIEHL